MLTGIGNLESTPPLYYLISWLWVQIVPDTEVGLRALPALFGVALVPVTYWIGRELADARAATISAALVACNPFLVWYSQEARSYSLLALLSAVALLFAVRAVKRPSGRLYAGWALASALALATHYFAAFLIVPEAVILLRLAPRRRVVAAAVGFVAAAGAFLLPLALQQQSMGHAAWISNAPIIGRLATTPLDFLVGFDLTSAALPVAVNRRGGGARGLGAPRRVPALRRSRSAPGGDDARRHLHPAAGTRAVGLDYLDPRN